jgi:molecular chaperone GrpE
LERARPSEEAVRKQLKQEADEVAGAESAPAPEADGAAAAAAKPEIEAEKAAQSEPEQAEADRAEAEQAEAEAEPEQAEAEDPVALAQRERDEYLELAKRTQADFENYRKRATKEAAAAGARARTGLIREILPVVDNLERALASADDADEGFVEGVRLVYSELQGVLSRTGVEPIEPVGEQFDPTVHEALSTREQDGAEAGVVLDVVEKGYRTADTVIRPARVIVAA